MIKKIRRNKLLLTDAPFVYLFLPLFMGAYALVPNRARPALIAAANIFMLASHGKECVIFFLISFISSYFSAIEIYNMRKKAEDAFYCRKNLAANIALNVLLFFLSTWKTVSDMPNGLLFTVRLFGSAVIPLHTISYLTDVYRGDRPAQTDLLTLAAYTAFFPSLSFGPVMKYKNFSQSFSSPVMTVTKTAAGIRMFVIGLAEYKLIAQPLNNVRQAVLAADIELFSAPAMWLSVIILYAEFAVGVFSMLTIGRGVSMMLGFYCKPVVKRRFMRCSVREELYTFNIPLASWFKDYVYRPLSNGAVKNSAKDIAACAAAVFLCSMWYSFSPVWLISALLFTLAAAAEKAGYRYVQKLPQALKWISARLAAALFAVSAAVKICSQTGSSGIFSQIFFAPVTENDPFFLIADISLLLTAAALILVGSAFEELLRRINAVWLRAVAPAVILLLIMLSTAFMLYG